MMQYPTGFMPPHMLGMCPLLGGAVLHVSAPYSSSESSSSESVAAKQPITGKGIIPLLKASEKRLQNILRTIAPKLDCITTAYWDGRRICRMIWIVVRVKPTAILSQFQANPYGDIYARDATRATSITSTMPSGLLESDIDRMLLLDPAVLK